MSGGAKAPCYSEAFGPGPLWGPLFLLWGSVPVYNPEEVPPFVTLEDQDYEFSISPSEFYSLLGPHISAAV